MSADVFGGIGHGSREIELDPEMRGIPIITPETYTVTD
jgi:hypothetical protein